MRKQHCAAFLGAIHQRMDAPAISLLYQAHFVAVIVRNAC